MTERQQQILAIIANSKVNIRANGEELISFHHKDMPADATLEDFAFLHREGYVEHRFTDTCSPSVFASTMGRRFLKLPNRGPCIAVNRNHAPMMD